MKINIDKKPNQTELHKNKTLFNKISHQANLVTDWCFTHGFNALFGAVAYSCIQGVLSNAKNFKILNIFLYHRHLFTTNPLEVKELLDGDIASLKQEGLEIPKNVDSTRILQSVCPKQEYFNQLSLLYKTEITNSNTQITNILHLCLFLPVVEEILFRGIIQDVILKNMVGRFIKHVSPSHASFIDSKVYTAIRILLTTLSFSAMHDLQINRDAVSDKIADKQIFASLIMGVAFGILKEMRGLAASIGAHTINNFVAIIPGTFAQC